MLGVSFYTKEGANNMTCLPFSMDFANMDEAMLAIGNDNVSAHFLLTGRVLGRDMLPSAKFLKYHAMYSEMWKRVVSLNRRSSLIVINLPWDAMSWRGFALVEELRRSLFPPTSTVSKGHHPDGCGNIASWEISVPSVWYDYVLCSVYRLPLVILLACSLTAPFIGISFWSLLAALKLVLTVVFPLTWVYGCAVWCFQDGLLDGYPGARGLHSAGGLYWMVPSSTSMLLLALALDYNIFYFGRTFEFRKAGLSDLEAIREGLAATGPVITCAGVIFAIEFSGLFFSETTVNRQGGFVIVVGVLVDTFLVRSCLMPAVLSLGASANWWPSRMPPPTDDDEIESGLLTQSSMMFASRTATMESEADLCCGGSDL